MTESFERIFNENRPARTAPSRWPSWAVAAARGPRAAVRSLRLVRIAPKTKLVERILNEIPTTEYSPVPRAELTIQQREAPGPLFVRCGSSGGA